MSIAYSILNLTLIFGLSFLLWKQQAPSMKTVFWPALAFKLAAGLCLGWLYSRYYHTGDTFVYFNDASRLSGLARDDFSAYVEALVANRHLESLAISLAEPRALFLTKMASVFNLLSGDQYWLSGVYFSFVSFLGALSLVRAVIAYAGPVRTAAVVAFLFLPSVVFWTSGLLKESLAMAALFFLAGMFLKVWFGQRPKAWQYVVALAGLLVLWNLKYYYAAVFIPVVVVCLFYKFVIRGRFSTRPALALGIWLGLFSVPMIAVTFVHPNFNLDRILTVMISNNALYNALSSPDNLVHFSDLQPTPLAIALNTPQALFSGLFRPLPWEVHSVITLFAALENTLLLVLFVAALSRFRTGLSSPHRLLLFGAVVYIVILCVFITISAPNLGTLSRYRVGYLPFFVFVLLCDNPLLQSAQRTFSRLVSH